jgi:hypothetical protein
MIDLTQYTPRPVALFTVTELRSKTLKVLEASQKGPVAIQRNNEIINIINGAVSAPEPKGSRKKRSS